MLCANRDPSALRRLHVEEATRPIVDDCECSVGALAHAAAIVTPWDALTGTSRQPHRRAPQLFLVMLVRNRRVGVGPAHVRRVSVRAGSGTERRIVKTITAASRRRSLAPSQGVKAAAQSAVFRDVTAAILVWARRGRCCTAKKCCAGDRRGARSQKLFHVLSPGFVCGLEGPRETRPSRPPFELVEGCEERLAGHHVDVGTGWSTVQSPPAIETMPCGSTASTPEVVAAEGLTRIMLPARNRRDYDDIPAGAREKLEFCVARTRRRRKSLSRGRGSSSGCAGSRCRDADRAVRGGRAVRAATTWAARPNPCVVIGPSRIRLFDRGSGVLLTRVGMRSREFFAGL
jgi:hypothetical protein